MKSPPPELAHRLRAAPTPELLALVRENLLRFTLKELRQTLMNPYVTGEVIEEIALARKLVADYEVRRALARHRRTPETVAMRFVSGLFWRDLLEISLDVRIRPAVRRLAEKYLIQRLGRLAVGEKITLARRAPHDVARQLLRDPDLRVVQALLENPRLTEEIVVRLAAGSPSPRILDLVARNPQWGRRIEVRSALAKNTASPFRVILDILPTLGSDDLGAVAVEEAHSSVVRGRAREILGARRDRGDDAPEEEVPWIDPPDELA